MPPGPREYTNITIKKLYGFSKNRCYNPDCKKLLIGRDEVTQISKISHIEGASEKGPRYNKNMSNDERRDYKNLILLCDECHCIIDNPKNEITYPAVLLKEWKKTREDEVKEEHFKNPSLLRTAVNALSNLNLEEIPHEKQEINVFKISDKISYNNLKRNKVLLDDYKIYHSKIDSLYNELEKHGSFKKNKLLRNIKNIYLKIKGNYIGNSNQPIEIIRLNADNIFEGVQEELFKLLEGETKENIFVEISLIMVDAFIRCKILEEPQNDNK